MITKKKLEQLYSNEGKSMQEIANALCCSVSGVQYWIRKYKIKTRSISDAVYLKNNPNGDPFLFKKPDSFERAILFGLGIGLYWGEGTKANKTSVRLGNTDPALIETFIVFLEKIFGLKRSQLRFGLQIFSDMSEAQGLDFWSKTLTIEKSQFYKVTITPYRSLGTYRNKTKYGVVTVYFHNRKLRDILVKLLETGVWKKVLKQKDKPL
ncbi:MAG: hypothetical protein Q8O53_02120 [Candidatus Moranbacteria bacterium]|nr:hypothetical protein [Candidatus Moranbacteria bacterium]